MLKHLTIYAVLFFLPIFNYAQSETTEKTNSLQSVVINLFDALADLDTAKARNCCESDIKILESGKIWNFDSLALRISTRKAKSSDYKRINKFEFIETKIAGNIGYVSYFNYATISFDGRSTKVKWIETAVLLREKKSWKIALLHSTELERTP